MRELLADDPGAVGGHRLLARLGAGGMGVVYLARSPGGALVALKVIRAEHAADPAFRARFRREVAAAGRLRGRWLVPVVAADVQAPAPWLATAFVPGPALTEAVDGHGPLPEPAVRDLGARLAATLTEVHRALLVHRDVKPGNVLLALDGPRLIDFGIARTAGATALTDSDAVIGSPGYLSPEQARAGDARVGPASDVFSLGCVLAYAVSGRRPFGTGNPAAVVYRTVHEEPDLDGVPRGRLRDLIESCMAKDPAARPTAADLASALGPPGGADWLPPALLRIVAERSARALDVPAPRRRAPARDQDPGGTAGPPRRRLLALGSAAAGVLAAGTGTAYLLSRRRAPAGTASAGAPPVHTLGLQADLSGPGRAEGLAHDHGVRLAVARHNADEDAVFRLALKVLDDGGTADRARDVARRFAADASVRAVIGPTTAVGAQAAAGIYRSARTAMVLVSVDGAQIATGDTGTLCVTRAAEDTLPLPLIHHLTEVHAVAHTAVIRDDAAGPAAWDLARSFTEAPPGGGTTTVQGVAAGSRDFAPAVRAALAAGAQAVVYAGTSPRRAARCARALAHAGFKGPRCGTWHLMDRAFLADAGAAAQGWLFSSPCSAPGAAKEFASSYRARYAAPPPRWSPEAYDAVGLLARTLGELRATGTVQRGAVAQRIVRVAHTGVAKRIRFASDGTRLIAWDSALFLYQARGGAFRCLGTYARTQQASPG